VTHSFIYQLGTIKGFEEKPTPKGYIMW